MEELVEKIAYCIERGKVNQASPFPPELRGQDGADELAKSALENGLNPDKILEGSMIGMKRIGDKFSQNKAFVPELLMAAKAMTAAMEHLKPYFQSGEVKHKGRFIIGTVAGDLHDIGKNLVSMVIEGNGWEVVDLGVNVNSERFISEVNKNPDSIVGLSALLTTTMPNMEKTVKDIKAKFPEIKIIVGGAPLTQNFADKIGADAYAKDPQTAVSILENLAA